MIDSLLEKKFQRADYILLRYRLRFEDEFVLPAYALLRLRRELSRILKSEPSRSKADMALNNLLRPALPTDPVLLRRVQQPAPGFVLHVDQLSSRSFNAGDQLTLSVCFFARGMSLVEPFTCLLEALGTVGLNDNQGRFHVETIEDGSELSANEKLWSGGPLQLAATISDLAQLLDNRTGASVSLDFSTPARLIKKGKPLFRPEFADIFPFILRRVTGMLAAWADLEDIFENDYMLECAAKVTVSDNQLKWQDWRPLQQKDEAGGVCGSIVLEGRELDELWPVLRAGELLGIGKGAAFGAGRYKLT